ncbi:MAG: hypothetical protein EOP47_16600 [Sphingobacteriaceae bacterium]|nr:MAG: hypothetical protein EOP47_16600 [Sphingobacteriaceae bacterium]
MKIKLLAVAITASVFIIQGCSKTDKEFKKDTQVTGIENSSGIRLNAYAVGAYGDFQLLSTVNSKCAQVADFSLQNGGTTKLASYSGEPHQQWRLTYMGNGYFKFMNHGSGKFLQAYKYNDMQVVIQNNEANTDSQLWRLYEVSPKKYKAISKSTGLAMSNNDNVSILQPYEAKASQIWGLNVLPYSSYRDDVVTRFFQRTTGTQAWDGNMSVKLTYGANNGKVLWVTNDEYYNQLENGRIKCYGKSVFFHKNNAALLQPASLSWDPALTNNYFVTSNGKQYDEEVFHDFSGKVLWPGNGVEVGSKIYVSNIQVQGLNLVGQFIGVIDQSNNTSTLLTVPGLSDQAATGRIEYSIGMVKDGGYVYNYGKNGSNVYVARFAENTPLVWTFWNGTTWAAKAVVTTAARVLSGLPSGGINVAKVNGKYVLISHDFGFGCDGGRNFYTWTSTGPNVVFTNKKTVFKRTDYQQGHLPVFYTPIMHPDITNGKNELLVTYCVNFYGSCIPLCTGTTSEDPDGYRPKAFRVPYSMIGI